MGAGSGFGTPASTGGGGGTIGGSGTAGYISQFTAGTTIGNSPLYNNAGKIGLGTTGPSAFFHIVGTTEQFRAGYDDATNYFKSTTGSTGITTFEAFGTAQSFVFKTNGGVGILNISDTSIWNSGAGSIITNTAFGSEAMPVNTTGFQNTGIGYAALFKNTTGNYNVAIGSYTLLNNTTGEENTACGSDALGMNISGLGCSALGRQAGFKNTTGNYNTSFGNLAVYNTTTGGFNTGLGYGSLFQNTTGSNNVAIGPYAGYSAVAVDANVFIGYAAGRYETAGNTLYIHNGLGVSNEASGKTNSLIYGTFDATAANQTLTVNGYITSMGITITPKQVTIPGTDIIDWNATHHPRTLSANTTFTFSNAADAKTIIIAITNTVGNYTVTWPAGVLWTGGVEPTQTIGAKTDVYTLVQINGSIYGSYVQDLS